MDSEDAINKLQDISSYAADIDHDINKVIEFIENDGGIKVDKTIGCILSRLKPTSNDPEYEIWEKYMSDIYEELSYYEDISLCSWDQWRRYCYLVNDEEGNE